MLEAMKIKIKINGKSDRFAAHTVQTMMLISTFRAPTDRKYNIFFFPVECDAL